ncbi:heme uptake protein IsdC [Paenibacillus sp. strain BS8-2]
MKAKVMISGMLAALWIALLIWPAGAMAAGDLADGTYTADYLILKAENDSVSMANDYWEKPATVTIKDGKAKIRVTINHSFWVTEFKVPGSGGSFVDTKVISSNKKADTRLVEFSADITKPMLSKIHVTVEEIDYDHDYTIRFVFDPDSFKLVKGAAPAATATSKPTEKPAAAVSAEPAATNKPAATVKPAQEGAQSTASTSEGATSGKTKDEAAASTAPVTTATDSGAAAKEENVESSASPVTEQDAGADNDSNNETVKEESGDKETAELVAESETQQADTDVSGGETVSVLAAGESADENSGEIAGESGGSGLVWWTPIVALLILAAGGFYIWRRKKVE